MMKTMRAALFAALTIPALAIFACGGGAASVPGPFVIPIPPAAASSDDRAAESEPETAPPPAAPSRTFLPNVVEGMVPSADGVPIHYTSEGDGDSAVVFVHCWGCNAHYWDDAARYVLSKHRVVTLDLAGHGISGKGRAKWTVHAFAEDVRAVVNKLLLKRVVLVGHSMSGPIVVETAASFPDGIVGLVPIDTLHDVNRTMTPERRKKFFDEFRKDWPGTVNKLVRSLFPKGSNAALVDRVVAEEIKNDPKIAIPILEDNFGYPTAKRLELVKVPIRCINADLYPTNVEANRKVYAQFDAKIIDGVGHWPMLESPDRFDALLLATVDELFEAKK